MCVCVLMKLWIYNCGGCQGRGGVVTLLFVVIPSQMRLINCCHFNPLSQIPSFCPSTISSATDSLLLLILVASSATSPWEKTQKRQSGAHLSGVPQGNDLIRLQKFKSSWSYLCASTWGFSLFPRLLASALCLFWLCRPHLYFSVFPSSSFVLLRFFCLSLHLWDPPPFRITPEHDNTFIVTSIGVPQKKNFRSFFRGHLADFHLERYKQEFERRVCFRPSPLTFTTRRKPTQLVVLLHHETSLPTANESKEEEQGKTRIFSVCGRCCFVLFLLTAKLLVQFSSWRRCFQNSVGCFGVRLEQINCISIHFNREWRFEMRWAQNPFKLYLKAIRVQ